MEYLETLGIPVLGFRTDTLPLFYAATGGPPVPQRVDDVAAAARTASAALAARWVRTPARERAAGEPRRRGSHRGGGRRGCATGRLRPGSDAVRARVPARALGRSHARGESQAHRHERPARRRRLGSVLRPVSLYDAVGDLPLEIEGYALDLLELAGAPGFPPQDERRPPHGRRRGGDRRGRHVRRRGARPPPGAWARPRARRVLDARLLLRAPRHAAALRAEPAAARVLRLPALGVRERGARPRAPPGRTIARGSGRPRATTGLVRGLGGLGDPPSTEQLHAWLALYPGLRFKLDATPGVDGRSRRGAGGDRRGRLDRLQGPVPRHGRGHTSRSDSLPTGRRGPARRWLEDPGLTDETIAVLEPHRDRVTWDAIIHSIEDIEYAALAAEDRERQAVAVRIGRAAVRRIRLLRGSRDRRVRRRPVGARTGPGPHSVPGRAVPPVDAERCRASRVQPRAAAGLPQSPLTVTPRETGFLAL